MSRQVRDTFTKYVANNIGTDMNGTAITVHQMRFDNTTPSADALQMNAINLQFANPDFDVVAATAAQLLLVHVVADDEFLALDWTERLARLLFKAASTPKLDYTIPLSPVPAGGAIFWDTKIKFRPISKEHYAHFLANISLRHHFS